MTVKEIQKLIQHKIPNEQTVQKLLTQDTITGAELGSLLFAEILKTIKGEKKTAENQSFFDIFYQKRNLLNGNDHSIIEIWTDFCNYIAIIYRIVSYQNTICYLGISKIMDTLTALFNVNLADKNINYLTKTLPQQWLQPIMDAIYYILGWNCFVCIACDFFGIQKTIQKKISFTETDNLLAHLHKYKTMLQDSLETDWEKELGQKLKEDIIIKLKTTLANIKTLAEIEPPTQKSIKKFTKNFYKAIITGEAQDKFYEYNETMLRMFFVEME